jgi:hypothetical protein
MTMYYGITMNSADVTRLLLLFSGAALILIGFFGISLDLLHDWRIEEYSSLIALLIGAAILLATTVVYVVIPGFQSRQRTESLKQYYMSGSKGEIKNINHAIMERSQGLIASTEMLADLSHSCDKEDITLEECKNNVLSARKMLEQINYESAKLNELMTDLEGYVNHKKD